MDIAPDYRGKGIASKVLEKVCDDAKNEGYLYVEAYPFLDEKYPYQFHGPAKMYKNRGFQLFDKKSWFLIMQKKL
ncbi:MAG: GNAT family N-acetyltransferase [Inconstantimicrobium porci]|uniref:GNAT family N-acetyltransferase n=1 Tax=Inconstantimicrobium porci TaxID=2652291 RepID=UPI002409A135|nr:GNAT family N-acetyltransferase [Inconstantimicrobium porci]MDD6769620.1 GNAT family N-acetyltransferase [Inconstantimicrobium porci]MDY5911509.1 GNAT family N-acetyltransferase [Inconstantimicrobium porci]